MSNKNFDYSKREERQVNEVDEIIETSESIDELTSELEDDVEVIEPVKEETKIGVVDNCERLNVRSEPNPQAEIVCAINKATEVVIDEVKSTNEFYNICLSSGIEGFCMKRYITIQQ